MTSLQQTRASKTLAVAYSLLHGKDDVLVRNWGFIREALEIDVRGLTHFLFAVQSDSLTFSPMCEPKYYKHAKTCSLQYTCGTDAATCSANKHARLEGIIIVTAYNCFLHAVTVVGSCLLLCVAIKRHRQHGCKWTVLAVQTVCTGQ